MADKNPSSGHSMFGLNDEPTQRVVAPEAAPVPAQTQAGTPQYVYVPVQQPVPAAGGSKVLPWLVALLLVLGLANLGSVAEDALADSTMTR